MYSLNLLDRNVLITADEVVKKVNVSSIDPHVFLAAIEIAEERFVRPLLGYDLYEAMIAQKNVVVTEENMADLQEHITLKDENGIYRLKEDDIVNALELFTTASYKTLWKERLWKFTAECVYLLCISENYAQFTTQGIVKNNPSPAFMESGSKGQSSGIDLKDVKWLTDSAMMGRIEPLRVALQEYLHRNGTLFPLYRVNCNDEVKPARTTGWVTGIHDKKRHNGWD